MRVRGSWRSIMLELLTNGYMSKPPEAYFAFNCTLLILLIFPSFLLPHQCERLVHTLHGVAPQRRGIKVEQIPGGGGQQSPRPPGGGS